MKFNYLMCIEDIGDTWKMLCIYKMREKKPYQNLYSINDGDNFHLFSKAIKEKHFIEINLMEE